MPGCRGLRLAAGLHSASDCTAQRGTTITVASLHLRHPACAFHVTKSISRLCARLCSWSPSEVAHLDRIPSVSVQSSALCNCIGRTGSCMQLLTTQNVGMQANASLGPCAFLEEWLANWHFCVALGAAATSAHGHTLSH